MKVNGINTFNYSNINSNNKQYATRPVFKQNQTAGVVQAAIVDQFIESAKEKESTTNPLKSKLNFFKNILFSKDTEDNAKLLKEAIENYDSILYKI